MSTATPRHATEREIDYFRRLGEFERQNDAQMRREHFARTLLERLNRSAARTDSLVKRTTDNSHPELLYERAKALGLYRA